MSGVSKPHSMLEQIRSRAKYQQERPWEYHYPSEVLFLLGELERLEEQFDVLVLAVKENSEVNPITYRLAHLIGDRPDWPGAEEFSHAETSNPATGAAFEREPVQPTPPESTGEAPVPASGAGTSSAEGTNEANAAGPRESSPAKRPT